VHNVQEGITLPPNPDQVFAVVRVKGLQYKVSKDDRVMCELLEDFEVGAQIELEDVLLVGTKDYTCVGRPVVSKARVFATVEETSQTEKSLIFKKRRRKDSQRHQGHRQWVTVLRIDRVVHDVQEGEVATLPLEALSLKPTVSII
jgi:large subunit ribosomal protein L21